MGTKIDFKDDLVYKAHLFSKRSSSSDFDSSLDNIRRTRNPVMKRRISDIAYSVCSSSRKEESDRNYMSHARCSKVENLLKGRFIHWSELSPAISCFSSMGAGGGTTLRALDELNLLEAFMTLWGGIGRFGAGESVTLTSNVYSHDADSVSGALHASEIGITNPFYFMDNKTRKKFQRLLALKNEILSSIQSYERKFNSTGSCTKSLSMFQVRQTHLWW